jgi:hypothetical protein
MCPHDRGVFIWLADGPEADGTYPWVHDTTVGPGLLEVCGLMPFATAAEAGEVCACRHSSGRHVAAPGPILAGLAANLRPCDCGCPDFRHWADGQPMYATRMACGCEPVFHHRLKPGDYLSCGATLAHQTSYRVEAVTQVKAVGGKPVQLVLFGGAG